MIKGVSSAEEIIIKNILQPYMNEYDFFYYGSRVKGTHGKTSDLDILIKGSQPFPFEGLDAIKQAFDESSLSYIVNFSDFQKIDSSFYDLIKEDLNKIV